MNDHDLLIKIHTNLKSLSESTQRILEDHEKRLRHNEKSISSTEGVQRSQLKTIRIYGAIGSVAAAVLGFFSLNK